LDALLLVRMIPRQVSGRLAPLVERARDELEVARYKNRYLYRHGKQRVPIDELISPLRYDILVRLEFFRLYAGQKELFDRDLDLLIEASRKHPYFNWFRTINCRKLHPEILRDEQTFNAAFSHRVRQAANLYERFAARGFDRNHPIVLYACKRLEPTASGKFVNRVVYMGNGCHRLALLKLAGYKWLEKEMYVTKTYRTYSPLDNTIDLLQQQPLSSSEYFSFLSLGYGGILRDSKEAFLNYVLDNQPQRYAEVLQVISRDKKVFDLGGSP
jgi:hypothetical protein